MAKRFSAVPVPVTVSSGAARDVSDLTSVNLSIASVGSATYHVEVSYDGTSFVQDGANVTADANVSIPDAAMKVRVRASVYASGTPVGALAGIKA